MCAKHRDNAVEIGATKCVLLFKFLHIFDRTILVVLFSVKLTIELHFALITKLDSKLFM